MDIPSCTFSEGDLIGEGKMHRVVEGGSGDVLKHPKTDKISPKQAQESLKFISEAFGNFIPTTQLIIKGDTYTVVQEKIIGQRLGDIPKSEISKKTLLQLLELINISILLRKTSGYHIDLVGPAFNNGDINFLQGKGHISKRVNILMQLGSLLKSVNIIVDENGDIFMVDNVTKLIRLGLKRGLEFQILTAFQKRSVQSLLASNSN